MTGDALDRVLADAFERTPYYCPMRLTWCDTKHECRDAHPVRPPAANAEPWRCKLAAERAAITGYRRSA